jgi:hypothetical protein
MINNILKVIGLVSILSLSSCNYFTRAVGGNMTVELEKDQKLINCSWKQTDLWVLTRVRKEGEQPDTYKYTEKSTYGVLEGTVTIVEK